MTTRIQKQLDQSRKRIARLNRRKRADAAKRKQKLIAKARGKAGRPKLDEQLIVKAIKLAEKFTLPEVALRLGIPRSTLYNYGISRKELEKETSK